MNEISEAQWVITYKCALNRVSKYCSLGGHAQNEAKLEQKLQAVKTFAQIGVKTLKILGGEPFDIEKIDKIIATFNDSKTDFVVTTNGINSQKILSIAKEIGFKPNSGLFFSMDFLDENAKNLIGGCSQIKTMAAIKMIPQLISLVPLLGVNTVVHSQNLDELPKILAWITDLGGHMNICPLIWGNWERFLYRATDREFALRPEHQLKVEQTMAVLLKMKRQGYHIACSEEYLASLAEVCCQNNRFGWDCGHLSCCPLLRVNSDLTLMVCSDLRGNRAKKFQLNNLLDQTQYAAFQQAWLKDNDRLRCAAKYGCYWSNIWRAIDNFGKGGSFIK